MLAAEGAKMVLAARRERELERVADGIRQAGGVAVPVVTDLADDGSLARLLEAAQDEAGPGGSAGQQRRVRGVEAARGDHDRRVGPHLRR